MAKGNNALLIFDFDNTITNGHMHSVFRNGEKSDFNSTQNNAVTDHNIKNFLKDTGGVKNEERLKSTLQSALSSGMEVNIASYTGYPNAVKKVAEDYLGLSEEQANSISVFGGFPANYDTQLPRQDVREQQSQVGKNLHICKAIVKYKNKYGELPKAVMLVDDDARNIQKIDEFVASMSKRGGWLKENGLSVEDIKNIKFEGAQVPMNRNGKAIGDANYLERVQEFISTNLVQYENLKKEEPIYQNLQETQRSSEEELPPPLPPKPGFNTKTVPPLSPKPKNLNVKAKSPLPLKKGKSNKVYIDSGMVTNGENKKQIHTHNISLRGQTEAHLPYCSELNLGTSMQELRSFFQKDGFPEKAIYAIRSLFKEKVMEAIREQGDIVNEKSEVLYIESHHHHGNDSEITANSLTQIMAQVQGKKKKIKDLASNYKGEDSQLKQKMSELLNVNLQTEGINSVSLRKRPSERQTPPLPSQKRKSANDIAIGSENKKQAYIETISLLKAFETIRDFFQDCSQKIINAICNLFRKEVITKIEGQSYDVNSEKGESEITIYGNKSIDVDKIKTDVIDISLIQIMELDEEKIKDLGNNYKGDQLEREISKLLNADLQKKDINSNSVGGNYNGGEPTHQNVQEARNYHRQKKGIDSNPVSKKPLAPPVPPKSRMEAVKTKGKAEAIEKSRWFV